MNDASVERLAKDDQVVIRTAAQLLEWAHRQTLIAYADRDFAPISELDVTRMVRMLGAAIEERELVAKVQEIGFPAYFGPPTIAVSSQLNRGTRALALRHGLAHLIAGELAAEEDAAIRFMENTGDWMILAERRADLFALVDLIPARELRLALEFDIPTQDHVLERIEELEAPWPIERVRDRAKLRCAFFHAVEG